MKLLYAEDERAMSEAVVDILTYHKYIVDAVYDGEDAYFYAKSEQYDGLILDIMMPKKTGLEVLEQLRGELPAELKKAQDLIRRRDEYVEDAKKEAERIRRQAELDAKTIVGESEIARVARDKARDIVTQANDRSKTIINVANEYADDALRRTEEAIQQALEEVRDSRARFRAVSREKLQSQQARLEEQNGSRQS